MRASKTRFGSFSLRLIRGVAALAILCALSPDNGHAREPWVGFFFSPQANSNDSHGMFMYDFEAMVKDLKARGINTVVFDMNYGAYNFSSDINMKKASYPRSRGFTFSEARRMAGIARSNGMHLLVALQVLTHSVGNVFPHVYPGYMLPGKGWRSGVSYSAKSDYVQHGGRSYQCLKTHTSSPSNAPPAPGYWVANPSDTRDPFNREGEAVVCGMIDELIDAFTVNGVKPDGFHIGCDELGWWYDSPESQTGMTSAQIFAMAVSNAYNHIKSKNPDMEVVMWGDTLDAKWNGAPRAANNAACRNTAAAIDMIPKGMVIADWRYNASQSFGYDSVREIFPSIGGFLDKGFRVWPTSWAEVKGTRDLVWTGNMEQARTGRVMGHLYSTWLGGIVPELKRLLAHPDLQVTDSVLADIGKGDSERFRGYYRGIADSINATASLVGLKECRGTDYFCGSYPACEDAIGKSGYFGGEFMAYYCDNNKILHRPLNFPGDYVGCWRFDGNATDATGVNNGILKNGASIVKDIERGRAVQFKGAGESVRVRDSESLRMGRGSLSISAWFKAAPSSELGAIVSKGLTNYALFLHRDGRVLLETNGNEFHRYSADGVSYRDNRWHHVAAVFENSAPAINIYLDGVVANGTSSSANGGNDKSGVSDLFIGANDGSSQYQFRGEIDDLMIFNRALSPAEVKMIHQRQKSQ